MQTTIGSIEKRIVAQHRSNEASKRLDHPRHWSYWGHHDRSGRPRSEGFSVWAVIFVQPVIGIVPRQDPTGGKQKLGPISKQGDQYLEAGILIVGEPMTVLRRARQQPENYPWLTQLLARRPFKVVAGVALANKMARIAWALLAKGGTYRSAPTRGSLTRSSAMGG